MTSAEDTGSAFIGFYPADDPEIAFSGFVEHGEYSKFMIKQIIEAYYDKDYVPPHPTIIIKEPEKVMADIPVEADSGAAVTDVTDAAAVTAATAGEVSGTDVSTVG